MSYDQHHPAADALVTKPGRYRLNPPHVLAVPSTGVDCLPPGQCSQFRLACLACSSSGLEQWFKPLFLMPPACLSMISVCLIACKQFEQALVDRFWLVIVTNLEQMPKHVLQKHSQIAFLYSIKNLNLQWIKFLNPWQPVAADF